MSFLGIFRRRSTASIPSSADQIIWGVRRKYGYSEIDDPAVHSGLVQHAFVVGDYSVALCGAKPYGFRRPARIRLAVPTGENPACRKCSTAIAFEVSETVSTHRLTEMTTPADRAEIEQALKVARRALTAGPPVSLELKRNRRGDALIEIPMHSWPVKDFSQAA
jgi:hypothetical protein